MSNEDKRRRRDGSTAQLSVAELLARREAETQPIPIYRDDEEDTIRFQAVTPPAEATAPAALSTVRIDRQSLSGRELHVAELLRREGRPADDERGGLKISKLVAIASGGVVLCGTVAFGASQWLSSPDERPLADVRFDDRPAARNSNNTGGIGALALPGQQANPSTQGSTTTQQQTETQQQAAQTQEQQRTAATQQAPVTQQQPVDTTTTTTETTTQQPTPNKGTPTQDPTTTTTTPSSSTQPTTSTSTPSSSSSNSSSNSSSSNSTPSSSETTPSSGLGLGVGVGLGGFDFFAEL